MNNLVNNKEEMINELADLMRLRAAEGKAETFDCGTEELEKKATMVELFGQKLSENTIAVPGVPQTFYKDEVIGWTYYSEVTCVKFEKEGKNEERFMLSLSRVYRSRRGMSEMTPPEAVLLLFQNKEDRNPVEIKDEANLGISFRTSNFKIYKESERSILFNTDSSSSYLYRLEKDNQRIVSLRKLEGSDDLVLTKKSIEKVDADGVSQNVISFIEDITPAVMAKDSEGNWYEQTPIKVNHNIKIMHKEKEKLSKVLGFRSSLEIYKAKLFAETKDEYMLMFRLLAGSSYKSCFVQINKTTGEVNYTKDSGRASIVKVTDHEGNMSVNFYNTTSNRVANNQIQKDKNNTYSFDSLDTYKINKENKETGNRIKGIFTIDAKEGVREVDVLTTANTHGMSRYSSRNEETVTIIVKDSELWLREQTIGNHSWGDSFEITEIRDKKLIDIKDAQREFLINYFDIEELIDIENSRHAHSRGYYSWSTLCEVYKPILRYDAEAEELSFLKEIQLETINDFLTGNPSWRMEGYYNNEGIRNRLLPLFKKFKKNQTVYKFSISDNNFKSLKKYVMDKEDYCSPAKQLDKMNRTSQEELDKINKKNSIVSL